MTKRLKVYLVIVFAAACLACTFAGCKIGRPGKAEMIAGYDGQITYYSNGGSFNDSETTTVIEIYYKAGDKGVPFFNITKETDSFGMKVERTGYDLRGWYEPARYTAEEAARYPGLVKENDIKFEISYIPDGNGNITDGDLDNIGSVVTEPVFPLKNEQGGDITDSENDRPMFARVNEDGTLKDEQIIEARVTAVCDETKLIAGFTEDESEVNNLTVERDTNMAACALWERSASIRYNLVVTDEKGNVLSDKEGEDPTYYNVTDENGNIVKRYKNGDHIVMRTMHGDSATPLDMELEAMDGLTFVRTYMDEALTERVHSVERPQERNAIVDVYCRYVVGGWTVVRAQTDTELLTQYENRIRAMFNGLWNAENKYLVIDDIDGTGFKAFPLKVGSMNTGKSRATIYVDSDTPLTMNNLSFEVSGSIARRQYYSIFGEIGAEFKISGGGLILKNTRITLSSTLQPYYFYAVCSAADSAAAANVNLTVDTIFVTYQLALEGSINGVVSGGSFPDDSWLFGGDRAPFTGITITGNNTITEYRETDLPEPQA